MVKRPRPHCALNHDVMPFVRKGYPPLHKRQCNRPPTLMLIAFCVGAISESLRFTDFYRTCI
jgi:hypothetical protein